MRLSKFLASNQELILAEAVTFARTIPALQARDAAELQDHLSPILDAIARDLESPETAAESKAKSQGKAPKSDGETAAQVHGRTRARLGIDVKQLASEYRALRASVLRLWADAADPDRHALEDMTRFNEAIDQALAESIGFYAAERDRMRAVLLGVIGHDLRQPLNAIGLTTEVIKRQVGPDLMPHVEAQRRVVGHMTNLLDSLVELTRASAGSAGLDKHLVDLAEIFGEEVELLRAAHAETEIEFETHGRATGQFDASAMRRMLGNLVSNAVQHGKAGAPVRVLLSAKEASVEVSVENAGSLGTTDVAELFEPMRRGKAPTAAQAGSHLGLGLFVVKQVARAHDGDVAALEEAGRVRFVVTMPRR